MGVVVAFETAPAKVHQNKDCLCFGNGALGLHWCGFSLAGDPGGLKRSQASYRFLLWKWVTYQAKSWYSVVEVGGGWIRGRIASHKVMEKTQFYPGSAPS